MIHCFSLRTYTARTTVNEQTNEQLVLAVFTEGRGHEFGREHWASFSPIVGCASPLIPETIDCVLRQRFDWSTLSPPLRSISKGILFYILTDWAGRSYKASVSIFFCSWSNQRGIFLHSSQDRLTGVDCARVQKLDFLVTKYIWRVCYRFLIL